MRMPSWTPSRPVDMTTHVADHRSSLREADGAQVEPAKCCVEVCVDTPFGRVCHCTLDLPFC
jgi:hypothetical protein